MKETRAIWNDLADSLLKTLRQQGIVHADIRFEHHQSERLQAENGSVTHIGQSQGQGYCIRVLHGGAWGIASGHIETDAELQDTAVRAFEMAKAASAALSSPIALTPLDAAVAEYTAPCASDPFTLPMDRKLQDLLQAHEALLGPDVIRRAETLFSFHRVHKYFCSTDGSRIWQTLTDSGAAHEVMASDHNTSCQRSYPNSFNSALAQGGYEVINGLNLVRGASEIRDEAQALLTAPEPKSGPTTLVLHPTQVALQVHESCGHPVELDRALGYEISFAGGSFLTPDKLKSFRYGSDCVNITADATTPGGVGSFAFDDEGVPGQRIPIIERGRFVNYLSSRETAATLGLQFSGGHMRAESWDVAPVIRMSNIHLEPGDATLDSLISDIRHGYLLSTTKSWSIDDRRLHFQFTTEIGWEIENGRIGRMIKPTLYSGVTPNFWNACSGISNRDTWQLFGLPNCGKGEPMQTLSVGHGAPYARFENIPIRPAQ